MKIKGKYKKIKAELFSCGVRYRNNMPLYIYKALAAIKGYQIPVNNLPYDKEAAEALQFYQKTGIFRQIPTHERTKQKKRVRPAAVENKDTKPKETESFIKSDDFLRSFEWRRVRYFALKGNNGRCELCGRSSKEGIILNVDHVKPRKLFPNLALDIKNLQVLCNECNHGKGNADQTDWRKPLDNGMPF